MSPALANALVLVGIAAAFPGVALAIGYALLGRARWLDRVERFAAAWGVGFAAIAAGQFTAFLAGADSRVVLPPFLIGAFVVSALLGRFVLPAREADGGDFDASPWPLAVGWLGFAAHLGLIQTLLPAYLGGGWAFDWWMHYEKARVFVGHLPVETVWVEKYTIASRTPLMNLTLAAVLGAAGDQFWVYQFASVVTNSVVVLPLALIAGRLGGRRAGRLALVAAPLNVWLLHEGWFTWTKLLAAYYLFLSLHFYLRWRATPENRPATAWRRFLACWIASLLAFLTHQITIVYT
ncbi:MAG: hypothetical protein K2X97_07850, partial [Mycobacteriaceae bacterium]|nr:hypothetical protein [Mycobacteriaceae bacterium]